MREANTSGDNTFAKGIVTLIVEVFVIVGELRSESQ